MERSEGSGAFVGKKIAGPRGERSLRDRANKELNLQRKGESPELMVVLLFYDLIKNAYLNAATNSFASS